MIMKIRHFFWTLIISYSLHSYGIEQTTSEYPTENPPANSTQVNKDQQEVDDEAKEEEKSSELMAATAAVADIAVSILERIRLERIRMGNEKLPTKSGQNLTKKPETLSTNFIFEQHLNVLRGILEHKNSNLEEKKQDIVPVFPDRMLKDIAEVEKITDIIFKYVDIPLSKSHLNMMNKNYFLPRWNDFSDLFVKDQKHPEWSEHFDAWKKISNPNEKKIALLFGPKNYENLPRFPESPDHCPDDRINGIKVSSMTAPIMRGTGQSGRNYISFLLEDESTHKQYIRTIFQKSPPDPAKDHSPWASYDDRPRSYSWDCLNGISSRVYWTEPKIIFVW